MRTSGRDVRRHAHRSTLVVVCVTATSSLMRGYMKLGMIHWTPLLIVIRRRYCLPWTTTTLLLLTTFSTSAAFLSTTTKTAILRSTTVVTSTTTIRAISSINSIMSQSTPPPLETTKHKVNLLDLAASCVACAEAASRVIKAIAEPPKSENSNDDDDDTTNNNDISTANTNNANDETHHQSSSMKKNTRLKDDGSFVTDADFAAQGIIVEAIRAISPHVRIVGEESAEEMALHSSNNSKYHDYYYHPNHKNNEVYRRAQQEIRLRYQRQVVQPMPLAQGISIPLNTKDDNDEEDVAMTTDQSVAASEQMILPDFQDPDDYYVDASRVGVIVDPLDGTKSYAQGDYDAVSVLICIIVDNEPYFGVIGKPFGYPEGANLTSVLDRSCVIVYGGPLIKGVYIAGGREIVASPLIKKTTTNSSDLPRAVISSSRSIGEVQDFCAHLAAQELIHEEPILISGAGEKSLRLILQVNNEALWFFPKKGTSLWDVAASDAILRSLGGRLTDKFGNSMDYSKAREDAENMEGVVACIDAKLHAKCIELYRQGNWANRGYK